MPVEPAEVDRHDGVGYGGTHGHYHRNQQQRVRRQYHANHCWCWISLRTETARNRHPGKRLFCFILLRPPVLTNLPVSLLPTPPTHFNQQETLLCFIMSARDLVKSSSSVASLVKLLYS